MTFAPTDFPGLLIIEPDVFSDHRGCFFESYNRMHFQQAGLDITFVQDNQSTSQYGVIRGLHFQLPPYSQAKLIRVLSGRIYDVVVDLRKGSPTFGQTYSIELSADNRKQLFVPAGFAHGFSVLSNWADVFYKCDNYYNKEAEAGILYSDLSLKINWQIPDEKIIVSEKDLRLPLFAALQSPFIYPA